ncbi:MAG: DEAD/DEAH box helicase family protein [Moorea sp. SIO4G2]|nr:DEAD/DEAH box helicase family protein [Moorena sp. SIO4A3]NEO59420.1 DEAD/DEAH box helicase family protein [Moorena sp. SIO4G2]
MICLAQRNKTIDFDQPFSIELGNNYKLRKYQQDLAERVLSQWKGGRQRVMAQLVTGGGKSVILSAIANYFVTQGLRILAIAHRKELITQLRDKLGEVTGLPVGCIKAGISPEPQHQIQVDNKRYRINSILYF